MTSPKHMRSDGVFTSAELGDGLDFDVKTLAGDLPPVIYAFRMPDDTIKIGYSASLNQRRLDLGVKWWDLLAIKPGTIQQELALHKKIPDAHRHHGEYYHPTPQIIAMLNKWRAAFNMPPIETRGAA